METVSKITMKDINANFLGEKQAQFIAAYTGIKGSQLAILNEPQRAKVFLGLVKQLELASSLHSQLGENNLTAKENLRGVLMEYFAGSSGDIGLLPNKINSLLAFGEIKDLSGTGIEDIHNQLSHFWRILGWEELALTNSQFEIKHTPGTIEEVENSCGNLIRTLEMLKEYWSEHNIGPHMVIPRGQPKAKRENAVGYAVVRQIDYPNATAIITNRNGDKPTADKQADYQEKALLMEKLMAKYPAEFAFVIFDYYCFVKGMEINAYNMAVLQEYVVGGQTRVKGLLSGKFSVAHGIKGQNGLFQYTHLAKSDSEVVVGSPTTTQIVAFDAAMAKGDSLLVTHGPVAYAINHFPPQLKAFEGSRNIILTVKQFAKAIGASKLDKPIINIAVGSATEMPVIEVNEDMLNGATHRVLTWLREHGINSLIIEAGHMHADRKPTKLQKTGIKTGAYLANVLAQKGIKITEQSMIDEDHVINTLSHSDYVTLIKSNGYNLKEIVYESSPVVREIAVAAMVNLMKAFPDHTYMEGDALLFNIPGTELQVELIKDITTSPFELGCVIFDVGLSLYKAYPELAKLYDESQEGITVHQGMFNIYGQNSTPQQRLQNVRLAYPYKTNNWSELAANPGLPQFPQDHRAVCNVLEGFYEPQQRKLIGVLKALNIDIPVVSVTITDQGLKVGIVD